MIYTDHPDYVDPSVDHDEDDGTMPNSIGELADAIIGHKIVAVDKDVTVKDKYGSRTATKLTLDNGETVSMIEVNDCCAYTDLEEIIEHLPSVEHAVTGITTSEGYTRWHILADLGEIMELRVGWSCGNPFYYGYGFEIAVNAEESD